MSIFGSNFNTDKGLARAVELSTRSVSNLLKFLDSESAVALVDPGR